MFDIEFDTQEVQSALPDYKFEKKLGVGSYGKVFLVRNRNTQQLLAMKKIHCFGLCDYQKSNATNQVRILASLDHQNIVKFHSSLFDSTEDDLYIFMQYAPQGDLCQIISQAKQKKKRISENMIWKIISQLAQGINYLHKNNILHRDIKPANVFKSNNLFKLGDMNVSKVMPVGSLAKTQIGSPLYTSPEIWNCQNGYNQKCDIWSLGVVIYELCTLKVPYEANSIDQLIRKLKTQRLKNIPNGYSPALNQIIHEMLQVNPKKRISASKIIQFCQQEGKLIKQEESEVYVQSLLDTIVFPESQQRWVNLVPLPPKSIKRQSNQSSKAQSKQKQKGDLSTNRSNIFAPIQKQNRSFLIPRSRNGINANSQQKLPKVKLPSIQKRNSSQQSERKSKERLLIKTPQKSRKSIQSTKAINVVNVKSIKNCPPLRKLSFNSRIEENMQIVAQKV